MSDETSIGQDVPSVAPVSLAPAPTLTRRQMLRNLAAGAVVGGLALTGGGILTACGGNTESTSTSPVTLTTGDWPFKPIPATAKKGDTDPYNKATVATLQTWLSKNKNVTLKYTAIDISTSQKLIAAVAARTAPDWYAGLGPGSTAAQNHFAGTLGLAAETTDILKKYNVDSLLADYAKPIWNAKWNLDGKFYGLPGDLVSAGAGLFYRRDLAKQKGIAEPKMGWTWDDFRTFAKAMATPGKPAMGAPKYMIGYLTNSNMLDTASHGGILGSVPVPNGNWHQQVNLSPWLQSWKDRVALYRTMIFDDKLIRQNATAYTWEGDAVAQMANGSFPMAPGFSSLLSIGGYAPVTIPDMPKKYNKPLDELIGYVPYPYGSNGAFNSSICPDYGAVLLNPHLKNGALDKAADLWLYMFFGDGYVDSRAMRYDLTKDPHVVYDYITPGNRFQKNPKVPANVTVENVFGAKIVADYMALINIPLVPSDGLYIPADKQAPPSDDSHDDMLQQLSSTQQDVEPILKKFQDIYNQQARSLSSSISPAEFKDGATKYYATLNSFWQKHAPTFYSGDWSTFYNSEVLPALK
ncbi:ABC transporter substrate-binding protein [Dictyobacter kobayashii]|uniref:ABC transporter substrate-binding protein n=1 Tax=Dictyobacter kobayashii TaxID=2014872 RepID=A0A402ASV9_9CHLR|nr:ABC transporter substrate-binding protein [Dictyobacter kobayashii]GCE22175.1 hypothetical protein KDK_59750 [Dictyobacter kobayashii]